MKIAKTIFLNCAICTIALSLFYILPDYVFSNGDCSFPNQQTALGSIVEVDPRPGNCANNPCPNPNAALCQAARDHAIRGAIKACNTRQGNCTNTKLCIPRINNFGACVLLCIDSSNVHFCAAQMLATFNCVCRQVPYTSNVSPSQGCVGITLSASTNILNPEYQWFVNDSAIVGATLSNYTTTRAGSYDVLITEATNDSDFALSDPAIIADCPLPVDMSSFASSVSLRTVRLSWVTASEQNNSGFEIERQNARSSNPDEWSNIGFVRGSGTTTSSTNYTFDDRDLSWGIYKYRLKQIDYNGNINYFNLQNEVEVGLPEKFTLYQNYPNPFNPSTRINYDIPDDGNVSLKIYDNTGKELKTLVNEFKTAGFYTTTFSAAGLASGVYYYRLQTGNFVSTMKMVVLK